MMNRNLSLAGLLVVVLIAAGCATKIVVTQYPAFYNHDDLSKNVKSIVIVPFRNQTTNREGKKAGQAIAENLAGRLGSSRSYQKVFNQNDFAAIMDQQEIAIAGGGDPNAVTKILRRHGKVQGLISGAVTTYQSNTSRHVRKIPRMRYNRRTRQSYVAGYTHQTITRNEGNVTVTATLTRVSNGSPIHSSPPITYRVVSEGVSPNSRQGCLQAARSKAVNALLAQFAVVRRTISVPNNVFNSAFQTAGSFDDSEQEWAKSTTFRTGDTQMFVTLKLPDTCDRNRFRISIARQDRPGNLAIQDIVWTKGHSEIPRGFQFNPSEIAGKGGGPGKYVAKFYPAQGPVKPKLFTKFEIK